MSINLLRHAMKTFKIIIVSLLIFPLTVFAAENSPKCEVADFAGLGEAKKRENVLSCLGVKPDGGSLPAVKPSYCSNSKRGYYFEHLDQLDATYGLNDKPTVPRRERDAAYQEKAKFYSCLGTPCGWYTTMTQREMEKKILSCYGVTPKPVEPPTRTSPKPPLPISAVSVKGEVEVSVDGGKTFSPWKEGMKLKKGDTVSTGFESSMNLAFSYGKLKVGQATQLRLDEFVDEQNIKRTQLYLNVGQVQAIIKKPANMRADFSVATPSAIASIRGSAMKVEYDKKKGATITALEGTTYWKIKRNKSEAELSEGEVLEVDINGKPSLLIIEDRIVEDRVVQTPGKPSKITLPNTMPSFGGCSKYPAKKVGKRLPATVSANSAADGGSVCKANDGSEATWWIASKESHPRNNVAWVQLDLGTSQKVGVLKWKGVVWDKDSHPGASPTHFKVEFSSDGKTWQQVNNFNYAKKIEKKDKPNTAGNVYLTKQGGGQLTARYLRLTTSQVNDGTGWALGLKEFWAE